MHLHAHHALYIEIYYGFLLLLFPAIVITKLLVMFTLLKT